MSPQLISKRALANQERQAYTVKMAHLGRATLLLVATFSSFAVVALVMIDQLYSPTVFVIDQLQIRGSFKHLKPQQIEAVVKQKPVGNFFSIELDEIKQRVEQLPWVQYARVRREWPNSLLIHVVEQEAVMRWQSDRWVNSLGQIIDLPITHALSKLIVLSGSEKDSRRMLHTAKQWAALLERNGLTLIGFTLSNRQAVSLTLKEISRQTPFELMLGRTEIEQRLARFLVLFEQQYKNGDQRLLRVDARYPDGLAIKSEQVEVTDQLAFNDSFSPPNQNHRTGN